MSSTSDFQVLTALPVIIIQQKRLVCDSDHNMVGGFTALRHGLEYNHLYLRVYTDPRRCVTLHSSGGHNHRLLSIRMYRTPHAQKCASHGDTSQCSRSKICRVRSCSRLLWIRYDACSIRLCKHFPKHNRAIMPEF